MVLTNLEIDRFFYLDAPLKLVFKDYVPKKVQHQHVYLVLTLWVTKKIVCSIMFQ